MTKHTLNSNLPTLPTFPVKGVLFSADEDDLIITPNAYGLEALQCFLNECSNPSDDDYTEGSAFEIIAWGQVDGCKKVMRVWSNVNCEVFSHIVKTENMECWYLEVEYAYERFVDMHREAAELAHKELMASTPRHPDNVKATEAATYELKAEFLRTFLPWREMAKLQQMGALPITAKNTHLVDAFLSQFTQAKACTKWTVPLMGLVVIRDMGVKATPEFIIVSGQNMTYTFSRATQRLLSLDDAGGHKHVYTYTDLKDGSVQRRAVRDGRITVTSVWDAQGRLVSEKNLAVEFTVEYAGDSFVPFKELYAEGTTCTNTYDEDGYTCILTEVTGDATGEVLEVITNPSSI